jgi:hypothetical protein
MPLAVMPTFATIMVSASLKTLACRWPVLLPRGADRQQHQIPSDAVASPDATTSGRQRCNQNNIKAAAMS